jgi:hypothetical protein
MNARRGGEKKLHYLYWLTMNFSCKNLPKLKRMMEPKI